MFVSDWRNVRSVDYSTNAVVSQWYSGTQTKYFRQNGMQGFIEKLNKRDTITLGIDYYALFNISKIWLDKLSPNIFKEVAQDVSEGKVVVIKIWYNGKLNYRFI